MKMKKLFILAIILTLITAVLPGCFPQDINNSSAASSEIVSTAISEQVLSNTSESLDSSIISNESTLSSESTVQKNQIEITFLDVGQGDCVLITTTEGKYILIDSGTLESKETVIGALRQKGVSEIEYAFFTHPHADHIGAADEIIKNFTVKNVYMPDAATTTQVYERLLSALEANTSVSVVQAIAGQTITLDGILLEILSPKDESYEDLNQYSIVLKMTYLETRFLFTGDATIENEKAMLESGFNLDVDLLKVGHHGSASSTSIDFLDATTPDYAVISVGKENDYGHPAGSTLDKLEGIDTYRTDINGTITVRSDGTEISVMTLK